ncbi:primase-helicase family protein, partial [Caballeronia sp. M23-90]
AAGAARAHGAWTEGWYYCVSNDKIVRPGTARIYTSKGFNSIFAKSVPLNTEGKRIAAHTHVAINAGFKVADAIMYAAGFPEVYSWKGRTFVNEYLESTVPETAAEFTPGGLEAIDTIRKHIGYMCAGNDLDGAPEGTVAAQLESWIALNVRSPGKVICCAPLIKGIEGDGKTVIMGKMMSRIMGGENAGEVSNQEVKSDFNAYFSGRAYRVFEEIRSADVNRFAILDTLKPAITNESVRVVGKNANGIDSPNTTNYAALTNHADALPITDTDRRWFVIFSYWKNIEEFEKKVGMTSRQYFDRLHKIMDEHYAEIRKFFLEYKVHSSVYHGMRAPKTKGRVEMKKAEDSRLGADYFDAYVANNECGVSAEVVASDSREHGRA